MKKLVPWIGYSGSTLQNTYGENLQHGYLVWDVDPKSHKHSVDFVPLKNHRPFVTIEWQGNVDATYEAAKEWPAGSRFRVRSSYSIPSTEATALSGKLRSERSATEVTFKYDDKDSSNRFASASIGLDVTNFATLESMLREYYADDTIEPEVMDSMLDVLRDAHAKTVAADSVARGTYWTIKKLEFDNLYAYGSGNVVDFDDKHGIVGIFGPNKIGKSSIVGAITYTLFNSSDRDVGKSAHVVNTKAKSGQSKAVISVAGSDYEINRVTTKLMQKGTLRATTSLSLRQLDGSGVDLTGEQRSDTEKNLKQLIGTYEDFSFTAGQVQDDVGKFLKEGATQRKSILSKFLGIDIFEKLYANLNDDLGTQRNAIKSIQTVEILEERMCEVRLEIEANEQLIKQATLDKENASSDLLKNKLVVHSLQDAVKQARNAAAANDELRKCVEKQSQLNVKLSLIESDLETCKTNVAELRASLDECDSWSDIAEKQRLINDVKLELSKASQLRDNAQRDVDHSKKISLKLLDVPCGDSFPTCVYIKDAHEEKRKLSDLVSNLEQQVAHVVDVQEKLAAFDEAAILVMNRRRKSLEDSLQRATQDLERCVSSKEACVSEIDKCDKFLKEHASLDENFDSNSVATYDAAVLEVNKLQSLIDKLDRDVNSYHVVHGKLEASLTQLAEQISTRKSIEKTLRTKELLTNAFSRKGIPNLVLNRLLPVVNEEISRVIDGVVSFSVSLKADEETNALDILLDDGNGDPRPLELGSGMERMISSLAIRTALSNVTTLPKPDFMIIDEGFGSLDDINAVACVSMLRSLKRWFRFILVISHVDIIKDAVDVAIEVSNNGTSSRVNA